ESAAPRSGVVLAGGYSLFQVNITAPNGIASVGEMRFVLGSSTSPENSCVAIYRPDGMRLLDNTGTTELGKLAPNVSASASNSQCALATLSVLSPSPTTLSLYFNILPNSIRYLGEKKLFVAVRHVLDSTIGEYQELGTVTVSSGCQVVVAPPL